MSDEEVAIQWVKQENEDPMNPEFKELNRALTDLRSELVRWKLAYKAGNVPLVNPFAVSLALGLAQAKRLHDEDGPRKLEGVR